MQTRHNNEGHWGDGIPTAKPMLHVRSRSLDHDVGLCVGISLVVRSLGHQAE